MADAFQADCDDNSDEEFCSKLFVPESRRHDLPPNPVVGQNVTKVSLKISVLDTEIGFDSMKVSAELLLTWRDPDLTIFNLNGDPLANLIASDTFSEIWIPTVLLTKILYQLLSTLF